MQARITVLMALYNGGSYLARSVRSVLDQTYKDFEFLIINDCSTDDSVRTIESFQDPRIRLLHNQQNLGQTRSLNVGLRAAQGEWVARIDADDIALAYWLEKHTAFIQKNPAFSVVSVDALVIDEQDRVQKKYRSPVHIDDIVLKAFFNSPINHVGCIMKKKDILAVGGYDEKYRTVADYDLWRKLICGDFLVTSLGETCVAVRRHAASYSFQDLSESYFDQIAEITLPIVTKYTLADLDHGQMRSVIRSLYNPEKVGDDEFDRALEILKKIIANIKHDKFENGQRIDFWSKRHMNNLMLKRIHARILMKDYRCVRRTALRGVSERGVLSPLTYFVPASYFGGLFLDFVPELHSFILRCRESSSEKLLSHQGAN
jgi:glycosyltransferase involved in cell wall biosynthesis